MKKKGKVEGYSMASKSIEPDPSSSETQSNNSSPSTNYATMSDQSNYTVDRWTRLRQLVKLHAARTKQGPDEDNKDNEGSEQELNEVDINAADKDGRTALHLVVESHRKQRLEVVRWLLTEHKADPHLKDKSGESALDLALQSRDDDMTLLLLEHGINNGTNASMCQNSDPFLTHNQPSSLSQKAKLLHFQRATATLLLDVARLKGSKSLAFLLRTRESLDLDANDLNGRTVLHLASGYGVVESVSLLLQKKPDLINADDKHKCKPIHMAAKAGNLDIICVLLVHGASVNSPSNLGSPVCVASYGGNVDVLKHLLDHPDVDQTLTNLDQESPLHLAIRGARQECCSLLLSHQDCPVDGVTLNQRRSVLHYVALYTDSPGWCTIVNELLVRGADLFLQDIDGQTAFHVAVRKHNVTLTKLLMKKLNEKSSPEENLLSHALAKHDHQHATPFRGMIKTMPELAKSVLDECIHTLSPKSIGGASSTAELKASSDSDSAGLCFDWSLLEDTFTEADAKGVITSTAKPYSKNYRFMKENHPLHIIAKKKQHHLLAHPVIKALVQQKWTLAAMHYFLFLCFYASHVISVSVYMISAAPPFQVNQSFCEIKLVEDIVLNLWNEAGQGYLQTGLTAAVVALACIGIILEVIQLVLSGTERLTDLHNICDWFTYISAVILIIDFTQCKTRADWQWQLGVACVFLAWMNLLFYLRKAPKIGIYIVMIGLILQTFLQFFAVFFLFILAFAITFHLLLQNQHPFKDVFLASMKTWVMMVGEMDYTDIFHSKHDDDSHEAQVYFPEATYAVFIVFLVLLSLIIMNLLTGLAIRDVNKLLEDSSYQLISMQITLALDVEYANPVWLQRKIVRRKQTIYNQKRKFSDSRKSLSNFFYGPLSTVHIRKEAEDILAQREENGSKEMDVVNSNFSNEDVMTMLTQLMEKVDAIEQKVNDQI